MRPEIKHLETTLSACLRIALLLTAPVYGAKAFAGLLASVARGDYPAGSNLLFVMTGGLPGIFAYRTAYA
ncbi:hypothetical protein HP532_17175 [Pseudomonas sp. CrR25]|nr:hypothetical protein [Pseudomonas sp. CrR25]